MPDAFTTGLFGGLIVLAALLLAFGVVWHFQPQVTTADRAVLAEQNLLRSPVLIGWVAKSEYVRAIDLGAFNLTSPIRPTEQIYPGKRIFNGLVFGSDSINIAAKDVSSITFKIDNTNGYGNLVVRVNDETVFNQLGSIGKYEIPVKRPGNATIEIATTSSGWQIWAPSVYDISNIVVHSYIPAARSWGIELAPADLSRAELEVITTKRIGSAKLKLGPKQIWSGSLVNMSVITISADDVRAAIANNQSLTLEADASSVLTGTALLKGYYTVYAPSTFEQTFELNRTAYDKLPATLRFEVSSVEAPGGISVKIWSDGQLTYTAYAAAKPTPYSFTLDKTALKLGTNRLQISSVDGGRFWIENIRLLL